MVMKGKNSKRRLLIGIDMLMCVLCGSLVYGIFYALGYLHNIKLATLILSFICLPLTMVMMMILTSSYRFSIRRSNLRHFYRYIVATLLGVALYVFLDLIFGFFDIIVYKLVSSVLSGFVMVISRLCYYNLAKDKNDNIGNDVKYNKKNEDILNKILGNDNTDSNEQELQQFFEGKSIMVTGAGGYIGSNLAKKIARYNCKRIVLIDIYENNLYMLKKHLEQFENNTRYIVEIASIRDYKKMDKLFSTYRPDIVYHAAAHKHVSLMENNPEEAVKNNIFGTYTCAKLADIYGVDKFILISSDKAINAVGIMGATKRICELIMQYMSGKTRSTKFASVRFCNVLGSNGSVLPIFEEQIRAGGPITITHKDATRYFMSVENAINLICQASVLARGNEIFVLRNGKEIYIKDLANMVIKANGLKPNRDIKIKYTGLYPGERLYEEKLIGELATEYKDIFYTRQAPIKGKNFYKKLNLLNVAVKENDRDNVNKLLMEILCDFDGNGFMRIDSMEVVDNEQKNIVINDELFDEAL